MPGTVSWRVRASWARRPSSMNSFVTRMPVVEADLVDQRLDALAHVDAGGDLGLLVQDPVDRHAQIALAADHVVAAELVVLADLLGTDEQPLGEALLRQAHIAAGRDAAGLELVADGARPADQFAGVEDRHDVHHVRHLHGADEGIVVGEDVAVADARDSPRSRSRIIHLMKRLMVWTCTMMPLERAIASPSGV